MTGISTTIPIMWIEAAHRIRAVDREQVEALRLSIRTVGLLNPISVCRLGEQSYRLIAGAHRLEAAKAEQYVEIDAVVHDLTDLEQIIAECDENLYGTKLTASERALFTAKRKEAYEAIYPETKHGANLLGNGVANFSTPETQRFTTNTAAATGQSERTVQLNAERGERVISEVLDMIRGTHLDTGVFLDKIKRYPPNEQVQITKRELAAERRSPSAISSFAQHGDDPKGSQPDQPQPALPTYEEMRAAILLLCKLKPNDIHSICPPAKRAPMCQRLGQLQKICEQVIEAVGQ